jgi:hypothetical protein
MCYLVAHSLLSKEPTMVRRAAFLLALAPVLLGATARAEEPTPLTGSWKLMVPTRDGGDRPFWLLKFEQKDAAWKATVLATMEGLPKGSVEGLGVEDDVVRFTVKIGRNRTPFEGRLPREGNKIRGTLKLGGRLAPVYMVKTELTSLDPTELLKEAVKTSEDPLEVMESALTLVNRSATLKAESAEVRSWAYRAIRAAREFGPTWQQYVTLQLVAILSKQKGYEAIAVQYARLAERSLKPGDSPRTRKEVLDALAEALSASGKEDEAKEVRARIAKLDFSIKPTPYAGRKGKSERVVLVELFTGAQCPPCVAADQAFDALAKTYKPSEVVLLQYHLHVPAPDPLTTSAGEERTSFYRRDVQSTPTVIISGVYPMVGGGGEEESQDRYQEFRAAIEPGLERPAKAKLSLQVERKGDKVDIAADVSELAEKGNDVRLRLVLVEEEISYTGRNGLARHHHVVVAFPGGVDGLVLTEKGKKNVSVDLGKVAKEWKDFQDKQAKEKPFFGEVPPIELKNLRIVAFIQNDETGEVLQATSAPVPGK